MSSVKKEKKRTSTAASDPAPEDVPAPVVKLESPINSIFSNPSAPPQKRIRVNGGGGGGDSGSSCTIKGTVLGLKKETFRNAQGQEVPKVRLHVAVESITSNGDIALVNTSVPGINYLLPAKDIDTPESNESGDRFAAKPRELLVDDYTKARWAGLVSPSFYTKSQKGEDLGVGKCCVGMPVEIRGIKCAYGKNNNAHRVYVNASKVIALKDDPVPKSKLPQVLMDAASTPNMMMWTAVATSMCMGGFFNVPFDNPILAEQAQAYKDLWEEAITSGANRLDAMANLKPGEASDALKNHAARVRAMTGDQLAQSARFFNEEEYDNLFAPILQTGLRPELRHPAAMIKLDSDDPADAESLPKFFSTAVCSNVSFNGLRVDLEFKIQWVGNKPKALAALEKRVSPIIHTPVAGIGSQMGLRDLAHTFGSMHKEKAMWAGQEIIPVAEMVIWAQIFAKNPHEDGIASEFPQIWAIDIPKTLAYASFLVTEAFVKEHLCGGATQYVPDAVKLDDKLELPKGVSDMPQFNESAYQELTYTGWKFSNLSTPKGYQREFRVLYQGAVDALRQDPSFAKDSTKAIEHLQTLSVAFAEETNGENDMGAFLSKNCLVYAVLVESLE